ncbi:MAG TPA: ferritin-like domain-containing protein [Nocardiopsis listeri]|uniref:hypothetical protein n=1 Tax=Nocardiopsis listeri TaxID=53440 RepID=UPI001D2CDDF5|nr:hypothetical protein [Nocardiopsis listeri]HJE61636.1 ferritin-like domain-containing protein [Nocardiopsis listeri]
MQGNVSRRTVLGVTATGVVAAGAVGGLSGCGTADWYPYDVTPDVSVLRSLIREKERTVARYEQALADGVSPGDLLEGFREHHLAHLDSLLEALPEGVGPSAEPEEPEGSDGTGTDPGRPLDTAGLRLVEAVASSSRLDQAAAVTDPGLAQLVSAIGACEAVHAHLLDEA